MESHQLVSKPEILEKFHDSIRLANRDDRNRSCSSVKAALKPIITVLSCISVWVIALLYFLFGAVGKLGTRPFPY